MTTNGGRLAGKVVLLSGTGGGQGRVAARMLVREGAKVVGTDIVGDLAEETAELVRGDGYEMINVSPIDLGVPAEAKQWVDRAVEEYGGVDVLYNNAGLPRFGPFEEMSEEDYRFTVRNEFDILWFSTQAAWPHLVKRGGGSIVNVGSIAGVIGMRSLPESAHAGSKGAVIAWTRQLAAEGAPHGIRANCISPGVINSPPTQEIMKLGDQSPLAPLIRSTALGRIGEPEDVVNAAIFLASDESSWITGINLMVDGGLTSIVNATL